MRETELVVSLGTIKKAQDFNKISSAFDEEITVKSNRYEVDAKSIMGIFSLNLLEPVRICLYSDNEQIISKFVEDMKQFTII